MMNNNNEQRETQLLTSKFRALPALHDIPHTHFVPHIFHFLCYHSTMVTMAVAKLLRDCKKCN